MWIYPGTDACAWQKKDPGDCWPEYYVHELHYALISLRINPFLEIFVLEGISCAKQYSLQFTMHKCLPEISALSILAPVFHREPPTTQAFWQIAYQAGSPH